MIVPFFRGISTSIVKIENTKARYNNGGFSYADNKLRDRT